MDPNAPRPEDASVPRHDAPVPPQAGEPGGEAPVVPDPHRGEALPEPQSGTRPGVDAGAVRPEQDEPGGPLAGLVGAASAQVAEEASPDGNVEAEATLAEMGVEEEGIESGQLLGFVVATLLVVGLLAVVLIYFIYAPFRGDTQARAGDVSLYPELEQTRVDGRAKLDQATRTGDAYTVPIGRAMGLVAAEYGAAAGAETAGLTRAQFNTLEVNRTMGRAVQAPPTVAGTAMGQSLPSGAANPADPSPAPVPRTLSDGQTQAATPGTALSGAATSDR